MDSVRDLIGDLCPSLIGDGTPGGWTPAVLGPSRLRLWLHADLGITLNGSDVSAWADQSGNGNDVAQSTPSKQPAYTGVVLTSGAQALDFDGVGHALTAGAFTVAETTHTVFAVVEMDAIGAVPGVSLLDSKTGRYIVIPGKSSAYSVFDGGYADGGTATTNLQSLVFDHNASETTVYRDGVVVANLASTGQALGGQLGIGASNAGTSLFLNGRIREVGVVAGAPLSADEIALLTAYHQRNSGTP